MNKIILEEIVNAWIKYTDEMTTDHGYNEEDYTVAAFISWLAYKLKKQ